MLTDVSGIVSVVFGNGEATSTPAQAALRFEVVRAHRGLSRDGPRPWPPPPFTETIWAC